MQEATMELNKVKNRFETTVEGHLCILQFALDGDIIHMNHVRVPKEVGGRGIAGELTRFALDHARSKGWRVIPNCPYVKKWIERHPEYANLAAGG